MVSTDNVNNGLALWGYSSLAREFDLDRRTVKDRIEKSGVKPASLIRGHPAYRIKDAALAILGIDIKQDSINRDPDKMLPDSRVKYFDAELKKLKLAEKEFTVILADDYAADLAINFKLMAQVLDTLPDLLTRDCELTAEQFDKVQKVCDLKREELYQAMIDE